MKKILILTNNASGLYSFRLELVERLLQDGHQVYLGMPYDERVNDFKSIGCYFVNVDIDRHGTNVIEDFKLFVLYFKLLKRIKPDMVFSYTIKPNIYGGFACQVNKIPYVANITGLGIAIENGGSLAKFLTFLYNVSLKKANRVFVQNEENKAFFVNNNIAVDKLKLIPGSGVNLKRFSPIGFPNEDKSVEFAFISRIMKEKGIDQYLEAAEFIKAKYPNTVFHVCGFCESEYEGRLKELADKGVVLYHGMVKDIKTILKDVSCVVHPTYYPEGISNVLLESSACARPIITTSRVGCREVIDDGINGFVVEQKNSKDLIEKIEKFMTLSNFQKKQMGLAGHKKIEAIFDRQIVVNAYMEELNKSCLD